MENENTSDSEEEILIYAEFADSVNIEKYRSIHVMGVNGKNPVIQMDDTFFTGNYETPLGTYMFFEEDPSPPCLDPLFDRIPPKNLKYMHKTRKFIKLEHAYVTPKTASDQSSTSEVREQNEDIEIIKFATIEEGLEKFRSILPNDPQPEFNPDDKSQTITESDIVMKT